VLGVVLVGGLGSVALAEGPPKPKLGDWIGRAVYTADRHVDIKLHVQHVHSVVVTDDGDGSPRKQEEDYFRATLTVPAEPGHASCPSWHFRDMRMHEVSGHLRFSDRNGSATEFIVGVVRSPTEIEIALSGPAGPSGPGGAFVSCGPHITAHPV
jgi:hypothetical protein